MNTLDDVSRQIGDLQGYVVEFLGISLFEEVEIAQISLR